MSDLTLFCPQCFADEGSGSWDHHVIRHDAGGHCTNCGNGSCIQIPKWAIDSIRQQASWVGKRHYPHDEDRERYVERQALLSLVVTFPGRTAERLADDTDPPSWNVSQVMPDGRRVMTIVRAPDEDCALHWSGLTYYTESQLAAKRDLARQSSADRDNEHMRRHSILGDIDRAIEQRNSTKNDGEGG
jgi:hypothetical protein